MFLRKKIEDFREICWESLQNRTETMKSYETKSRFIQINRKIHNITN